MSRLLIKIIWLTGFLQMGILVSHAQNSHLEGYIDYGLKNNLALQSKELSFKKSIQALREARGLFMPQVGFSASYTLANGGRAIQFPVGDLFNPIHATLNKLTDAQNFPTNLENVDEQFLPNNFQETKFRVVQPIFNADILMNVRAKESLTGMVAAERDIYRQELKKEIQTSYFNYLKTIEILKIYEETGELLAEILRINQRLVENQKATPEVISRAKLEIARLEEEKALAVQQHHSAKSYVNFLLNRPLNTDVLIDTGYSAENVAIMELDLAREAGTNSRPELAQLAYAKEANSYVVRLNRLSILPKVVAVADLGAQGYGYNFDQDQRFWLAQFSLQWDLFKGFQNDAKRQQVELDQAILYQQESQLEQQIQLQIQQAWYQVRAAEIAIEAAQSGLISAKETFQITRKKYLENQASMLELMDARTQFTRARLDLAIDTFEYYSKIAELEWASGGKGEF